VLAPDKINVPTPLFVNELIVEALLLAIVELIVKLLEILF